MDTLLAVIAAIVGTELAGVALMIGAPAQLKSVKRLFWACAALIGLWGLGWEVTTGAEMMLRILVGTLIGVFVFVVVPETIRHFGNFAQAQTPQSSSAPQPNADTSSQGGTFLFKNIDGSTIEDNHVNGGPGKFQFENLKDTKVDKNSVEATSKPENNSK